MERGYSYLLKNLMDSVYEMMLKLDEKESSGICIYYTPDLTAYLLGGGDIKNKLKGLPSFAEGKLGKISVSYTDDGRIGLSVGRDGIDYIMRTNSERRFLKNLIEKVRDRNCTIDDIKRIFEAESENYRCIETSGDEFNYVVYFMDSSIDEYKYCFTFDVMGSYYHRFTDYDYKKLTSH